MTTNCLTTATLIVCNLPPKLWNPAFWMNCVAFPPLILCYNSFLANHLMKIIQESVLLSQAAIQTTTTLPALFSPEMYSLTVLQPKVWNQGIDRPCSPPTALGRVILYLFQLLILQAFLGFWWHHSILCLHFRRAIFSPLPVSQVLSLRRTLLLDLMPFFVVQGDLFIKFMKAFFPKKIWFGGLEHGHIFCRGWGRDSMQPTAEGNGKSSLCEYLTEAGLGGFTPISHMDGETLQSASSDNTLRTQWSSLCQH